MIDKKEIRTELWHSLDMAWVRKCLFSALIITAAAILVGMIRLTGLSASETFTVCLGTFGITMLPVLIFCLWRTLRIFWKPEAYVFCRALLDHPKGGMLRNTVQFTVVVEGQDGRKYAVDTHSIFATHGIAGPLLEDYVNRTVTVAYNEQTETVVVIG